MSGPSIPAKAPVPPDPPTPGSARPSKAQKVLRRTLTGGALVVSVAGLLAWTHASPRGMPILQAATLILLVAIWETSRMGSFAVRDILPPLLVPTIGVVLLAFASVEALGRAVPGPDGGASSQDLAIVYVWCAALALASHGLLVSLRQWSKHPAVARGGTYLVFGGIVMFVTQDALEARTNLGPGLVACAILGATTLPLVLRRPRGGSNLLVAVLLAIWIVPPLPALWHVWNTWSIGGLVALLVCSKIGDTAGYYVGTAIGRHHPFPRISPGKTTEGCLGSLAAGTLAGGAFVAFGLLPGDIVQGLLAGAVANLAAQSGDLVESFVKRRVGVKDSSGMFGPSGGLLDQLDSLLVSIPAAVLVWPWILPVGAGSH